RAGERVVEQPVEQILDGPRELREVARADHAAAALERVERASHGRERVLLERILIPDGELLRDLLQLLARLLDEELHQLRIGMLGERTGGVARSERRRHTDRLLRCTWLHRGWLRRGWLRRCRRMRRLGCSSLRGGRD